MAKMRMKPDATLPKLASNAIGIKCLCLAKASRLQSNQTKLATAPTVTKAQRGRTTKNE